MAVVGAALAWSSADIAAVDEHQSDISPTFEGSGSGKDVLDALFFLLGERGFVRGMQVEAFHAEMRCGVRATDLPQWEVGRRLAAWQREHKLVLIPGL